MVLYMVHILVVVWGLRSVMIRKSITVVNTGILATLCRSSGFPVHSSCQVVTVCVIIVPISGCFPIIFQLSGVVGAHSQDKKIWDTITQCSTAGGLTINANEIAPHLSDVAKFNGNVQKFWCKIRYF